MEFTLDFLINLGALIWAVAPLFLGLGVIIATLAGGKAGAPRIAFTTALLPPLL